MPFVNKTNSSSLEHSFEARKIFIGRTDELQFFLKNILEPENPTHNIISVSGQAGVGKSTLLSRFIDELQNRKFKDYCMVAQIDERQSTPASIMEKFAEQLDMKGDFERALINYKDILRKLQSERKNARGALWHKTASDIAGSMVKEVPIVGGILEKGAGPAIEYFFEELHYRQLLKDAEQLENPVGDLTRAFVEGLNRLADISILSNFDHIKHYHKVFLFFDTFEQLAQGTVPWLLDYFLQANISNHVVLVIAGRDSLQRSTPYDCKRWLPYYDDKIVHNICLDPFTKDEICTYLAERNIIETDRVTTFLQLSQGLPLYLSLLTANPQGSIDPTSDVVINFLRWIPEQEHIKRRLAIDAALLSKPFNQDDLEAFAYISESERYLLYQWLIEQPFVRSIPQDGRYIYHELTQELFSRYLYQSSPNAYHTTRNALARYYSKMLKNLENKEGRAIYHSPQWLELMLALAHQLFLLPDRLYHIQGIEKILNVYEHIGLTEEIVKVLRKLSHEQLGDQIGVDAHSYIHLISEYICADLSNRKKALLFYLRRFIKFASEQSFSQELLASLHHKSGVTLFSLQQYEKAISEFDKAIELEPSIALIYGSRGQTKFALKEYEQAIDDFNQAIEIEPAFAWTYTFRGFTFSALAEYDKATNDFNRAIEQEPTSAWAYAGRGENFRLSKQFESAIADFNQAIKLEPKSAWIYSCRGQSYLALKEYQQAADDFNRAVDLDSIFALNYSLLEEAYNNKLVSMFDSLIQPIEIRYRCSYCNLTLRFVPGKLGIHNNALTILNKQSLNQLLHISEELG